MAKTCLTSEGDAAARSSRCGSTTAARCAAGRARSTGSSACAGSVCATSRARDRFPGSSRRAGDPMSMTDPIADLLTRIRNGNQARKAQRRRAVVAYQGSGRPGPDRGGLSPRRDGGRRGRGEACCVIVLQLRRAAPAGDHRHPARQPPEPPRLRRQGEIPAVRGGLGINVLSTPHGVLVDREAQAARRRRRAPLRGVVRTIHVAHRQACRSRVPAGVTVARRGRTACAVKGPKGTLGAAVEPARRRSRSRAAT